MDRVKKARRPERSAVTKTVTAVEALLAMVPLPKVEIEAQLEALNRHLQKLTDLDEKVKELILDADGTTDEEVEAEWEAIAEYMKKADFVKAKANSVLYPVPAASPKNLTRSPTGSTSFRNKRTFQLPTIKLMGFSGELTHWLGWWAQFKKIDEDEDLSNSDKFVYLLQSMVAGSRAHELVASYPQTDENYPKAISALKDRYGRKKLLKQVYVRELIRMILDTRLKEQIPLATQYDRLESSLRSLESLGVTLEQMAEFLFPMVESSLTEDILLAWQRSPYFGLDGAQEDPPKSELDYLMNFLKSEIEHEEQRKLARAGFNLTSGDKRDLKRKRESDDEEDLPTASVLHSGVSMKPPCVFCGKGHASADCFKAKKMSVEDRKSKVMKSGACFVCLKTGHISRNCRSNVKCSLCSGKHHILLCVQNSSKEAQVNQVSEQPVTVQTNLSFTSPVILRTLMVDVINPIVNKKKRIRIFLDCGAQRSNIKKKTAEELGLAPVSEVTVDHSLFQGHELRGVRHKVYDVKLRSLDGGFILPIQVMDEETICKPLPRVTSGPWMEELRKRGIVINDVNPDDPLEIEILLGGDFLGSILPGNVYQMSNGLTATETFFGWALLGQEGKAESLAMSVMTMSVQTSTVAELWNLEAIGIADPVETKTRDERERAVQAHFVKTVTRTSEGRYVVSLPWIDGERRLPPNKTVALKRLETTSRKLKSLDRFVEYDDLLKFWEAEGIISTVEDLDSDELNCHYLPHRAVIKESKTTPVRPVFDASCKVGRSPSLNDCLEKGPNLLELIPSILLQFRMGIIGVLADIRKAFLMVEVTEQDRDFLRFLWWEDLTMKKVKTYRHNRVVFGMNCSPFLLSAVINFHLQHYKEIHPDSVRLIENSLYVDNLVTSVNSSEEYDRIRELSTQIMAEARMELRQWERSGLRGENEVTSVLGLKWDKLSDMLYCDPVSSTLPDKITKRVILSYVQQVFDPLGFLSPILILPKILLQKAWIQKKKWDEEISEEMRCEFVQWWEELSIVMHMIKLPRNCMGGSNREEAKLQLHVFSDASKKAYATAVFLRVETQCDVSVQLLQSKSRVAPAKGATIPRLELLSCTIAARLSSSVQRSVCKAAIPIFYWTDSTTALSWIKRSDEWGTFVGNRVKEICTLTNPADWYHVPGVLNPADLPSRGVRPKKFLEIRWWEGPKWLKMGRSEWPSGEWEADELAVGEEKKKGVLTLTVSTSVTPWYVMTGSYTKTLRVISLVVRFVDRLRKKPIDSTMTPTIRELNRAEMLLFRLVQKESFNTNETFISGLRVKLDCEGILRVQTKLLYRNDSSGFITPVILPNVHRLVDLLVREVHIQNCHGGVQFLIGKLREKVWIVQSRRAIKRVLRTCVACRRHDAKKLEVPPCALPEDRVKDAGVFDVTGIDLAGPLFLKNQSKIWCVLFTCGIFRCVHLELVESLTTEDFLLAFTRFCKRKRRPKTVYTDNGTNFVGAVNLFATIDWVAVEKETQQQRITWKFNPPSAPWWGGWWERLIRSVKDLLKRMLGRRSLTYVELETCLCEVESVINHRPLTFVSEDQDDLIPLTPAMFIYDLPDENVPETKLIHTPSFGSQRKSLEKLIQELKSRFRKEYLGQLVQRGKDHKTDQFKIGDVVLVEVDNKKRIFWPMARIIDLIPSRDGGTRLARVKTKTGEFLRPVQRLFPLEVDVSEHCPLVQKMKEIKSKPNEGDRVIEQKTRFGRVIRKPEKYCDY